MEENSFLSPLLVLGAGASSAFGVPTMADFLEEEWRALDGSTAAASVAVRRSLELHEVVDLEEVMYMLDTLASMKREDSLAAFTLKRIHGKFSGLEEFEFDKLRMEAEQEREKLRQIIYDKCTTYERAQAYETYKGLFESLSVVTHTKRIRVVTTNYDRIIEELWEWPEVPLHKSSPSLDLQTGFYRPPYGNPQLDPERGYPKDVRERDIVIHLIKVHGSLGWREYQEGRVEDTAAREYPGQFSVLAYPIRSDKSTEAPFSTLYSMFDDALSQSNLIIVIGMSLRDRAIVGRLADALRTGEKLGLIIDPAAEVVRNRLPQDVRHHVATHHASFGDKFWLDSEVAWEVLLEDALERSLDQRDAASDGG